MNSQDWSNDITEIDQRFSSACLILFFFITVMTITTRTWYYQISMDNFSLHRDGKIDGEREMGLTCTVSAPLQKSLCAFVILVNI